MDGWLYQSAPFPASSSSFPRVEIVADMAVAIAGWSCAHSFSVLASRPLHLIQAIAAVAISVAEPEPHTYFAHGGCLAPTQLPTSYSMIFYLQMHSLPSDIFRSFLTAEAYSIDTHIIHILDGVFRCICAACVYI